MILLKNPRSPFDGAQGERELRWHRRPISVHAEPVEAWDLVFQQNPQFIWILYPNFRLSN